MERLSSPTQLLYAELLQSLLVAANPKRGVSFHTKEVDGNRYWYMDYVLGEQRNAYYLGPADEELTALINTMKANWSDDAPDAKARAKLVAMVRAGGATEISGRHARVLEALAQAGVFAVGGVLVGSHAFALMGNMLGVRWEKAAMRTQDVDIAKDYTIHVNVPSADLPQALDATELGFIPVPSLNRKAASTSFKVRGEELSVSVLTPMRGKPDGSPITIPGLGTMAEPLRFLDYLLEDTQPAAVPVRQGVLVQVPSPARFALHKLVVSQRRPAAFATKSTKDIRQAELVLEVLLEDRPGDIMLAWEAAEMMPAKFMKELQLGLKQCAALIREEILALG